MSNFKLSPCNLKVCDSENIQYLTMTHGSRDWSFVKQD